MTNSMNGMKTRFWGPHAWVFLFTSVAGAYPVRVDPNNKEHMRVVRKFQAMLTSLEYTLPCFWCRHSYADYLKELPLDKYSGSRRDMMKWVYLLHDRVNKKLMKQELDKFKKEKELLMHKKLTKTQLQAKLKILKDKICRTKPSPPFTSILAEFEKQRA